MERYRLARSPRPDGASDGGFTLVEMVIGLVIFSIISSIAFMVITQMMTEGQAIVDTGIGIQQADQANESLLQWLRGTTSFLPQGTSGCIAGTQPQTANYFCAASNVGVLYHTVSSNGTTTTIPFGVTSDVLTALWCAGPIVSGACTAAQPHVDATFTVSVNGRVISEYYARPLVVGGVTQPTFTYYKDNGAGGLAALAAPVPACAYPEIYALGINVSFLAGPQRPAEGYAADLPSTLRTTIYLRNPTSTSSTTTSSTTSTTTCSE